MHNCRCCQQPLTDEKDYHAKCLKDLFGRARVPAIPFGLAEVPTQVVKTGARMSISGVQMKLSVRVNPDTWALETVAQGGTHILKPEPPLYSELPQNENLCMNIAAEFKLPVPPHGLFSLADGKPCYIIKRFDRLEDGTKLHKETIFQIIGAENKYQGSLEQIGKVILVHAANAGLDAIGFFERALLAFLTGNGDMHLKNWALLTGQDGRISLAPCYDFVSSKIYLPDEMDSALTINGKHNQLSGKDFERLAAFLKIGTKPMESIFRKFEQAREKLLQMCGSSELSQLLRERLAGVITARYERIYA